MNRRPVAAVVVTTIRVTGYIVLGTLALAAGIIVVLGIAAIAAMRPPRTRRPSR